MPYNKFFCNLIMPDLGTVKIVLMGTKTITITNFAIWILGFGFSERLELALDQSQLKTAWSWRAVQADRDTQKDKAWRAGF